LDAEEKELLLTIAQHQSDINIFMTLSAGQFAVMGVFLIAGLQLMIHGFPMDIGQMVAGLIISLIAIPSGMRAFQSLKHVKLSRERLYNIK
jgi:DMSO reductase anchor subunit